jgi:hypothetical protein
MGVNDIVITVPTHVGPGIEQERERALRSILANNCAQQIEHHFFHPLFQRLDLRLRPDDQVTARLPATGV